MRTDDVNAVARLHHSAMGNSFWARLGRPFLEAVYRALLDHVLFIGAVYEDEGRVRGFIAGSEDVSATLRDTFRRHAGALVWPTARSVASDPRLLRPLADTPFYGRRSRLADDVPAESLFNSFEPELRGRRVSGHANKLLFDELLFRGHSHVKITTEADNEAARRQLARWGFESRGRFRFYGKEMVTLVLDLRTSPRVDAVQRFPRGPA
jgi:hypothetical protein